MMKVVVLILTMEGGLEVKNMKYLVLLIFIIGFGLFLNQYSNIQDETIFTVPENDEYQKYVDHTPDSDRNYIVDKGAYEALVDDYNVQNLLKEEVYEVNSNLCLNFYFDPNASREDIENLKAVYSKMFFGKITMTYFPYFEAILQLDKYKEAVLRIFIGEKLMIYKAYDFKTFEENYYENMDSLVVSRNVSNEHVDRFESEIQSLLENSIVQVQKPFKPYLYHFKIVTKESLDGDTIDKIKLMVVNDLALQLEKDSKKLFGTNEDALGIVIKFVSEDGNYLELFYFNGEEKEWIDEDWMMMDLFLRNSLET